MCEHDDRLVQLLQMVASLNHENERLRSRLTEALDEVDRLNDLRLAAQVWTLLNGTSVGLRVLRFADTTWFSATDSDEGRAVANAVNNPDMRDLPVVEVRVHKSTELTYDLTMDQLPPVLTMLVRTVSAQMDRMLVAVPHLVAAR